MPSTTPFEGSSGVESTLPSVSPPVSSSKTSTSVNVPPTSTATLYMVAPFCHSACQHAALRAARQHAQACAFACQHAASLRSAASRHFSQVVSEPPHERRILLPSCATLRRVRQGEAGVGEADMLTKRRIRRAEGLSVQTG